MRGSVPPFRRHGGALLYRNRRKGMFCTGPASGRRLIRRRRLTRPLQRYLAFVMLTTTPCGQRAFRVASLYTQTSTAAALSEWLSVVNARAFDLTGTPP